MKGLNVRDGGGDFFWTLTVRSGDGGPGSFVLVTKNRKELAGTTLKLVVFQVFSSLVFPTSFRSKDLSSLLVSL